MYWVFTEDSCVTLCFNSFLPDFTGFYWVLLDFLTPIRFGAGFCQELEPSFHDLTSWNVGCTGFLPKILVFDFVLLGFNLILLGFT